MVYKVSSERPVILTSKCRAHGEGAITTYFNVLGLTQPGVELTTSRSWSRGESSTSEPPRPVFEKIFKWPHLIFAFLWLSPLWREAGPLFEQTWIPFTQGWFVLSLIEMVLLVLQKKIFIFSVFSLFCYYLPFDKGVPLHLNTLESPPPRMICAKSD